MERYSGLILMAPRLRQFLGGESDGVTDGILDLDIDVGDGKIYWAKRGGIIRSDMDGTNIENLVEIASYIQPTAIVVDTLRDYIFWSNTSNDNIERAKTDGSEVETIINAESPVALDLDIDNEKIYWIEDYIYSGGGGAIFQANLDGSDENIINETDSYYREGLYVKDWGSNYLH